MPRGADRPGPLAWRSHPFVEGGPVRAALSLAAVGAASAAAAWSSGRSFYGVVALALLGSSLSRYFAPTRYRLDAEGAEISHLGRRRQIGWSAVGMARTLSYGIYLSPLSRPGRLDSFRGQGPSSTPPWPWSCDPVASPHVPRVLLGQTRDSTGQQTGWQPVCRAERR